MSGIVGILNTDGTAVSPELLAEMTEFLRFRGPDGHNFRCDSEVGLGHTLLDTRDVRPACKQPYSCDGRTWIVADARIDARAGLADDVRRAGLAVPTPASDSQLILLAYQAWGKDCPNHLIGDFVFAIWDGARKELFCARDQFGIKPLYYASLPGCFVFSNTLNCVRLHPQLSTRLNDLAISDYLLFGANLESSTTSFEDIRRLPPAHSLTWSNRVLSVERYWTLPDIPTLNYKKGREYIEHFRGVFRLAVRDRLPEGPVAVSMSGGLDSSTVAAVASQELTGERKNCLHAYTVVYDRLIPDQERRFAGRVADFCKIPIHFLAADDYQLFQHWSGNDFRPAAQPSDQPFLAIDCEMYKNIASHTRVMLTGEGGDLCLVPSFDEIRAPVMRGKLWSLCSGYARCAWWQRTIPKAGFRSFLQYRKPPEKKATLPGWFNPDLAAELDLLSRIAEVEQRMPATQHSRLMAYRSLSGAWWDSFLQQYEAGNVPLPVEARHPFFDIRVVTFLLSLPSLPWCIGKQITREAMKGFLPPAVLRRRKSPLAGDPVSELLKRHEYRWIDSFQPTAELFRYVIPSRIPPLAGRQNSYEQAWLDLRPLQLNHWLRIEATVGYKGREQATEGACHGALDRAARQEKGV